MLPSTRSLVAAVTLFPWLVPPAAAGERDPHRAWRLGEAWGRSTAAGPHADAPPALPAPLRPDGWIVARTGLLADRADEALVLRYVVPDDAPRPKAGEPVLGRGEEVWRGADSASDDGEQAAFARVEVDAHQVRMARLAGARLLFVNGTPFLGDPERRGYRGVPVELREGENDLLVVGIEEGGFDLELWTPPTRIVIADWDVVVPRATEWSPPGALADGWIGTRPPLFNASADAATAIHVHYEPAREGREPACPGEWVDGWAAPPLGLVQPRGAWTFTMSDDPSGWAADRARTSLVAYAHDDPEADRIVLDLPLREDAWSPRPARPPAWPALADALPDVLVVPAGGGDALAAARLWQQRLWYHADHVPEVVLDRDLDERRDAKRHVVFLGDERTNAAWPPDLPPPDDTDPDTVRIVPRHDGTRFGTIRASTPAALRLLAAFDPFRDGIPDDPAVVLSVDSAGRLR
ncbi:MAG: hypothetical protein ACF8XB_20260 [Planctomycetota bacterium JB042]